MNRISFLSTSIIGCFNNSHHYCASEGLATAVRGAIDKQTLAKVMKLRPDQKVILTQSVGYPKK